MPEHGCYCEVFFGGGWVFFSKPLAKDEILNDINENLVGLYRVIQRDCDKFKAREKYELYSRSLYYEYLQDFYSGKHAGLDSVEKAFRFFYLVKGAFSGKFGAGFAFSSNRQQATSFFNEFKTLDDITKRLKNATIDCRDFESVIDSYDSDRTLIFADPPYLKSDNKDYYFKSVDKSFTLHDHQRLYLALRKAKSKFILTVDDAPFIRERYCSGDVVKVGDNLYFSKDTGFYWMNNEVYYCSGDSDNRRHEVELVIMNYNHLTENKHLECKQGRLQF